MNRMSLCSIVAALVLQTGALAAKPAAAPKPGGPPPACGLKALPLAVGNFWTYKSGSQQITIKVIEVTQGKDYAGKAATLIVTEETYQGRMVKATHSCSAANGLVASLDSFFFDGEPGGAVGTQLAITSRDKVTLMVDDQLITDQGWIETVKADAVRPDGGGAGVTHAPGKVEIERHISIKGEEKVMIQLGQFQALKVEFELRGRGIVGEQKVELPIERPAHQWLAKGIGYVKVEDAFHKNWELTESNLLPTPPAEQK